MIEGEGAADEMLYFDFVDEQPADGMNFYRLKLVFRDGNDLFSNVETLQFPIFEAIGVYPNPASDKLFVDLSEYGKMGGLYTCA